MTFISEKSGLYTLLSVECMECAERFQLEKSELFGSTQLIDINGKAVWGSMTTGGGSASLNE